MTTFDTVNTPLSELPQRFAATEAVVNTDEQPVDGITVAYTQDTEYADADQPTSHTLH